MKCEYCNNNLVNLYISDPKTKSKKTIGKICVHCDWPPREANQYWKNLQILKQREKQRQRKKPIYREIRGCGKCGCKTKSKINIRKLPKKEGETQHWKGTCLECDANWTQNVPYK